MIYNAPINSPWGRIQNSLCICYGVFNVSTAGHGGIMVDTDVADIVLSKEAQKVGFEDGHFLCFEEDCDAAVAIRELLDRGIMKPRVNRYFKEGEYSETINRSLQQWHPEYWEYYQSDNYWGRVLAKIYEPDISNDNKNVDERSGGER